MKEIKVIAQLEENDFDLTCLMIFQLLFVIHWWKRKIFHFNSVWVDRKFYGKKDIAEVELVVRRFQY